MSRSERIEFIDKFNKELSISKQCKLLNVNRSTIYYISQKDRNLDIVLLNEIRSIWKMIPFYGYRRITKELKSKGFQVNHKRVYRLMKRSGICALYPKPTLSERNKEHKMYPYLLRGLIINKSDQVWSVDITYLKLGRGFMYLVALIDIYSRYIVDWRLSNTLDAEHSVDMLERALSYKKPQMINSDQGCQFTSEKWINTLKANNIQISMDGKNRCLDNIYIERFWRSLKYEDFYLKDYASVPELKRGIKNYIEFYNNRRWHQSLNYKTPASVYFKKPVDLWTDPSDHPKPFGTYGKDVHNLMENANAFPTGCTTTFPHSLDFRPQDPQAR